MRIEIQPGIRLFVDIEGPGLVPDGDQMRQRPTLVLIHGGPGFDHSTFKPFFSRFTDVAQIVYLDLRSHGRSDLRPPDEWTLDTFADDVVRLCDALGVEKPIVLGQSFGGYVAQRYIARHPAHPSRVVLSSTSHHYNLAGKIAGFTRLGGQKAGAAARAFWEQPNAETWAEYDHLCRNAYNTTPQPTDARSRLLFRLDILLASAAGEQRSMQLLPGLARAQCPVLVMAGEEDPVTPIEDGLEIAAALPPQWVQLARFSSVGHGPWRDDPAATETVLRAFLTEQR